MQKILLFSKKLLPELIWLLIFVIIVVILQVVVIGYEQFSKGFLELPVGNTYWILSHTEITIKLLFFISFIVYNIRIWILKQKNIFTLGVSLFFNAIFLWLLVSIHLEFTVIYSNSNLAWVIIPPLSVLPTEPTPRPMISYLNEVFTALHLLAIIATIANSILFGKESILLKEKYKIQTKCINY